MRSFLTMDISMLSNTVNTEAARKYKILCKIYFKMQVVCLMHLEKGNCFGRCSKLQILEERSILEKWKLSKLG